MFPHDVPLTVGSERREDQISICVYRVDPVGLRRTVQCRTRLTRLLIFVDVDEVGLATRDFVDR